MDFLHRIFDYFVSHEVSTGGRMVTVGNTEFTPRHLTPDLEPCYKHGPSFDGNPHAKAVHFSDY